MFNKKGKQIISKVIIVLIILAMLIPMVVAAIPM